MEKPIDRQISKAILEIYRLDDSIDGVSFHKLKSKLNYDDIEKLIRLLRGLEDFGFVRINQRNKAKLTNRGRKLALELIRNNDLPESVISKILDISLGETVIKEPKLFYKKLDDCKNNSICRLVLVNPPKLVEILEIRTGNPHIEKQLLAIGIIPGVKAYVKTKAALGGTLILKIKDFEVALSRHVAHKIFVKIL